MVGVPLAVGGHDDVVAEFRLDRDGWFNYHGWPDAPDGTPFLFSDNTTISQLRSQNVTFVGVRYTHRWQ